MRSSGHRQKTTKKKKSGKTGKGTRQKLLGTPRKNEISHQTDASAVAQGFVDLTSLG